MVETLEKISYREGHKALETALKYAEQLEKPSSKVLLWKRLRDIEARKRLAVVLFLYHSKYEIINIDDLKTNFLSDRCKVIKINVISVCIQIRGFDNLYKIFYLFWVSFSVVRPS